MKKLSYILPILAVIFACVFILGSCGKSEKGYTEGLKFSLSEDGKTYTLVDIADATDKDIVIPAKYMNLPVTVIGDCAFEGSDIKSVVIPSGVTEIHYAAFADCASLTSVTLPDTLTSIGEYAFYETGVKNLTLPSSLKTVGESAFEMSALETIYVPDSVEELGEYLFYGCTSLREITVGENNAKLKSVDGNLYSKDGTVLIQYAVGKTAESFEIPAGVVTIGDDAAALCSSLKSIVIPDSVKEIGFEAFHNCDSLERVHIPASVERIGNFAFNFCGKLVEITVDENSTYFKSVDGNLYTKDGEDLLQYATGKTAELFAIPAGVKNLGAGAFENSEYLKAVILPNGLESIDSYALNGCSALEYIYCDGTEEDYEFTAVAGANDGFSLDKIYYYSEENPNKRGGFWHYNEEGEPEVWDVYAKGLTYKLNDDGESYSLQSTAGTDRLNVIIPETYEGLPVTGILDDAVGFSDRVAFLDIPKTVTYIDPNAFYMGMVLMSITVDEENEYYSAENGILYNKDKTTLLRVPINNQLKDNTLVVPEGVTEIAPRAVFYVRRAYYVELPSTIKTIGKGAFASCRDLETIIFPEGLETIGVAAFENAFTMTEIYIPDSVTEIGKFAFSGCEAITEFTIGANNKNYKVVDGNLYTKDESKLMFYAAGNTSESFEIPDSVKIIGEGAFCDVRALKSIVIPTSVTTICEEAFNGCTGLIGITVPSSVTELGPRVFYYCTGLESITVPDSITELPEGLFSRCFVLTEINLPSTLKKIGPLAFEFCEALENITIPEGVTEIGSEAFSGCYELKSITIPSGVTKIGSQAFAYTEIKTLYIPASVTEIGDGICTVCRNLISIEVDAANEYYTSVNGDLYTKDLTTFVQYSVAKEDTSFVIPSTVTKIGAGAFLLADKLTSITIPSSVTEIGEEAFYGVQFETITIPDGVTEIKYHTFATCYTMKSIVLPVSVTKIGQTVFDYCESLESIYYLGTPEQFDEIWVDPYYDFNACFTNATPYYYSESEPTPVEGIGYWHYDANGDVAVW